MKRVWLLFSLFLLQTIVVAQVRITGLVMNKDGEALPDVIIQQRDSLSHKLVSYTRSNSKGIYYIEAIAGNTLEFSHLGFRKQQIRVEENMKSLRTKMVEDLITLKEVIVKADKVREYGDTVTYEINRFSDRNDRSIGDVLTKIPGFTVDKNSGKISYEGKPISKFYIEGLDMLGQRYGTATNSLPQSDVRTVQVIRNHQPIRVLEDFTFTDETAINVRMKSDAKSHWVSSFNGGIGTGNHHGLWNFEGFGIRLKSDFQTMLTFKTNNIGKDVSKESTNLINFDETAIQQPQDFISLSAPSLPGLSLGRYLKNHSNAVTCNTMKRLNEISQLNFQLIYSNERDEAQGERQTEYFFTNHNRLINNMKSWANKRNELYAMLKYEHNSNRSYFKNSLSCNVIWDNQHLYEMGTNTHDQIAKVPIYDIRDNLYIIRRYGKHLVSFYSNNIFQRRPHHLYVDSFHQDVSQRYYATDTYAMGGMVLGKLSLSLKFGLKAMLRYLDARAVGLPDSIGLLSDKSHFGYIRLYASPNIEYGISDFKISLSVPFENIYYKYSADQGTDKFHVSPELGIRWNLTSRLLMSLRGSIIMEPLDFNHFYGSLIMQDYLYLNRGYAGYRTVTNRSLRYILLYRNALKGSHAMFTVTRSFNNNPYTITRDFTSDHIILSSTPIGTKSSSWHITTFLMQGFSWWNSKLSLRAIYLHNNSELLQGNELLPSISNSLTINGRLNISIWKDMSILYGLRYIYDNIALPSSGSRSSFYNWRNEISMTIPIHQFKIQFDEEFDHNRLTMGNYKNIFFSDMTIGYKSKHIDYEIRMSNLFNKKTYAYSITGDLMTVTSTNHIRGRELMFSIFYRP